jgi:hypothetical protein
MKQLIAVLSAQVQDSLVIRVLLAANGSLFAEVAMTNHGIVSVIAALISGACMVALIPTDRCKP